MTHICLTICLRCYVFIHFQQKKWEYIYNLIHFRDDSARSKSIAYMSTKRPVAVNLFICMYMNNPTGVLTSWKRPVGFSPIILGPTSIFYCARPTGLGCSAFSFMLIGSTPHPRVFYTYVHSGSEGDSPRFHTGGPTQHSPTKATGGGGHPNGGTAQHPARTGVTTFSR